MQADRDPRSSQPHGLSAPEVAAARAAHGWNELPEDLQTLFMVCCEQSHYYRQHWYWGGEAALRVNGTKLQLTTIPDEEWATVEAKARIFWDEIAAESETKAKVVAIIKQYNDVMRKAGPPYRYG